MALTLVHRAVERLLRDVLDLPVEGEGHGRALPLDRLRTRPGGGACGPWRRGAGPACSLWPDSSSSKASSRPSRPWPSVPTTPSTCARQLALRVEALGLLGEARGRGSPAPSPRRPPGASPAASPRRSACARASRAYEISAASRWSVLGQRRAPLAARPASMRRVEPDGVDLHALGERDAAAIEDVAAAGGDLDLPHVLVLRHRREPVPLEDLKADRAAPASPRGRRRGARPSPAPGRGSSG